MKRRRLSHGGGGLEGTAGPGEIACEIGPDYPGFVQAEDGACVPSGTTPAGIYVDKACADFVFVAGDDGPQPDNLELLVAGLSQQSKQPNGNSADPLIAAIGFLHKFWPACNWPPVADSPPRLVHMFEALNFHISRAIIAAGGRVLGTKSSDVADELVADRLSKLGLPDFDLQVVPELAEWVEGLGGEGGLGKTGETPTSSEIQRLKKKICDDPGGFTGFEKIAFINGVISPILDTRVEGLGANPSLAKLDAMFGNIAMTVLKACPIAKRGPGTALAKKFAHDLWVQRYHGGVGIDTSPPPFMPPPVQGGGGIKPPKLPACAVAPYLRTQTTLSTRAWHKSYDPYEIKIFEFAGQWAQCHDYDLTVAVCLQVVEPQKPYGHLSNYSPDFQPVLSLAQFGIQNTQNQPIQWDQFRSPPAFKQQLHTTVKLINGNVELWPVTDVTGTAAGAAVDPCADTPAQWPIPATSHFNVLGPDGNYYAWYSRPALEIVKKGNGIYLRVTYTGVAAFAAGQGGPNSARVTFFDSKLKLTIHSVTRGNTP